MGRGPGSVSRAILEVLADGRERSIYGITRDVFGTESESVARARAQNPDSLRRYWQPWAMR